MKKAEIPEPKARMVIRSYDAIPEPPAGGLVIKTSFCGICHSDVHLSDDEFHLGGDNVLNFSSMPGVTFPLVFGHEIAGAVHSLDCSGGDSDLKVGDKVVVYPWTGCDDCVYCNTGEGGKCLVDGLAMGCGRDGGFSEYVSVKKSANAVKLPENLSVDVACMLACSGLTGYNAVQKVKPTIDYFMNITGSASLLIIGAGGLGTWCLQTARATLPKGVKIAIADISEAKLEVAKANGADETVFWDRSKSEADIIAHTKSKGINGCFSAIIDFVNSNVSTSRNLQCLAKGGAMALVGLFGGSLQYPLPLLALQHYKIFGIYVGSLQQLKDLVNLVATSKLTPPNLTYVTLDEVPDILEKLKKGQVNGRALVKF